MQGRIEKRRLLASFLWMTPGLVLSGYIAVKRAGMAVLYRPVALEDWQIRRDICYQQDSADDKHRLDLFLPQGANWPVLIFIHGGSLTSGDKALRVSGADVYGNIGRFYASHGIGVAVINYRLQPKVTWREQAQDVAQATAWVHSHIGIHGGDPTRLFIGGHSAGAHLAARVALDAKYLGEIGLSPSLFNGVIAVSGAALDLRDIRTYELGAKLRQYETRFRCGDPTDNWRRDGSPIACIETATNVPPFLILYAKGESQALQRQSQLLHETLQRHAFLSELVTVPGQTHCRMVLALSRPDKIAGPAILRFIGREMEQSKVQSPKSKVRESLDFPLELSR